MARDEYGRRNTKKDKAINNFKLNGKFNGKHIRKMEELLQKQTINIQNN
jgi:hypothetical protein